MQHTVIEIAHGKTNRATAFSRETVETVDYYGKTYTDAFSSVYNHSTEIEDYYRTHGKLRGYSGQVYSNKLHFDIDDKNFPDNTINVTRKLIEAMCTRNDAFCFNIDDFRIWFSGSKGFHIFVENDTTRETMAASKNIPADTRSICLYLADGICEIDSAVYDCTRLWRIPNSINEKSGLYKIPVLAGELWSRSFPEIKKRAKSQRTLVHAQKEWMVNHAEFA